MMMMMIMMFASFQSSVRPFDAAQRAPGSGKSDAAEQELQQRELRGGGGAQQRRPESRATSRSVPPHRRSTSYTAGWGQNTFAWLGRRRNVLSLLSMQESDYLKMQFLNLADVFATQPCNETKLHPPSSSERESQRTLSVAGKGDKNVIKDPRSLNK